MPTRARVQKYVKSGLAVTRSKYATTGIEHRNLRRNDHVIEQVVRHDVVEIGVPVILAEISRWVNKKDISRGIVGRR